MNIGAFSIRKTVRRTICAALAASLSFLSLGAGAQVLPSMGDGHEMSIAAERKLGDRIARELFRDPDYIDDPILGEYIQNIWTPLLAAARTRGELPPELDERMAWRYLLGRDRTVNAFALPGGYMGIHLGLIGVVTSRDELASVMAHETSHITQRHIARMMSQQSKTTPLLFAAMILGAIALTRSPDAGSAMITGGQALAIQNQLNFSRDMEREADRIGYGVMTQAGFSSQGFVSMFDKLQQASRINDNGSYPYLRSHPLTTERIADMQARQQMDAKPGPTPPATMNHSMIAMRARVLADGNGSSMRSWIEDPTGTAYPSYSPARQAASLYGAALASMSQNNRVAAVGFTDKLLAVTANDPPSLRLARMLKAELSLAAGDADPALALAPVGGAPWSRPELLLVNGARVKTGAPPLVSMAAQSLQAWVTTNPTDSAAWTALSGAYAAQGQTLRSIRAAAESRYAQLDYQATVDRLRAAQDFVRKNSSGAANAPTDYIEASIIDTRLRQVESLLREQTLER